MYKKILNIHKRYWTGFIIFFLILLIPMLSLLPQGLPITHDGKDHLARIANFYMGLQDGIVFPRWAANLNWGYGHPILMFLYPLPSYSASLFHFLGFSITDSLKLVFFVSFISSGFAMYFFLKEVLNREAALLGGFLYSFAPYRFVDLYVRGALGEHVAFVFPPLVLLCMLKLAKRYSSFWMVFYAFSVAMLFLSHNAISIMFLPLFFVFGIYLLYIHKLKTNVLFRLLLGAVWGVGLSAFFLLPAFLEGKYTLRDIVTKNEYASRFVEIQSFFYSPWNYGGTALFSKEIGALQILGVIFSVIAFFKTKELDKRILFGIFFIVLLVSLYLCLPQSKIFYQIFTVLQKFQFPWRFLSLTLFSTAFLSAFAVHTIRDARARFMVFIFVAVIGVLLSWNQFKAKGYLVRPDSFYFSVYEGTTDTGESAPIWSVRFMEKKANFQTEVIEGEGQIESISRNTTTHVFTTLAKDKIRIRENTLYFPGWRVFIDGKETSIEFQDPKNRGLITFFVDKGTHTVRILFKETKLRKWADTITVFSFILILPVLVYGRRILK